MAKTYSASTAHGTIKLRYEQKKVDKLLKGERIQKRLLAQAEKIRARAASMYGAKSYGVRIKVGQTRARAIVYTASRHAMRSNISHNTLQKALGASKE